MLFRSVFGWIIFRAESIGQAWEYVCGICDKSLFSIPWLDDRHYYIPVFLSVLVLFLTEWIQRDKDYGFDLSGIKSHVVKFGIYYLMLVMLFWFGGHAESFIYFQF